MKKALFLFACASIAMTAHAKVKVFNDSPSILSVDEFSFEKIQGLIYSKNSDCIIELREGTTVPLQFLAMIAPNLAFKVEKTCYLRVENKKCYMSEDLIHWEKARKFTKRKAAIQIQQQNKTI